MKRYRISANPYGPVRKQVAYALKNHCGYTGPFAIENIGDENYWKGFMEVRIEPWRAACPDTRDRFVEHPDAVAVLFVVFIVAFLIGFILGVTA